MIDNTTFAGLTRQNVGDPLSDGLLHENPTIIDRLLEVGAVTHRHDAHAALADPDPLLIPVIEADPTGGTIPADLSVYVGYTLIDADGGETRLSDVEQVTTSPSLDVPELSPLLEVDHAAGSLLAGSYYYAVTVIDGSGGETALGPPSNIVIDPGSANSQILLSGLADIVDAVGGTGWRLWRTMNAGEWHLMDDGVADTLTDDGSLCAGCDVVPPSGTGTTNATSRLRVTIPGPAPDGALQFRVYGSVSGDFDSPAVLGTYPVADLDTEKTYTAFLPTPGTPPLVNMSLPGASKINAEADILNLAWKSPVADAAALPSGDNVTGDVRLVLDTLMVVVWDGDSWETPAPVLPERDEVVATAAALATNASLDVDVPLGRSYALLKVETSVPARVRVYATAAQRTADAARTIGTDPTGDHGLMYELVTATGDLVRTVAPVVIGTNMEAPTTEDAAVAITNLEVTTEDVVVTFTRLPQEK